MDVEKMGLFIAELRKLRGMTQKELAERLNISDKAVSKWERGMSCPDISLLSPLSDLLGVTTTELLGGARTGGESMDMEAIVADALEYGEKTVRRKMTLDRSLAAAIFSAVLMIAISVVSIVNVAVSGGFTWSLIVMSACVFAWTVAFPAIQFGAKGIVGSLLSVTVFIIPFLYVLDCGIGKMADTGGMVFQMGIRAAPLCVLFGWCAYFLVRRLRERILLAIGLLVLLASPVSCLSTLLIAGLLNRTYQGIELALNIFPSIMVATALFVVDAALQRRGR